MSTLIIVSGCFTDSLQVCLPGLHITLGVFMRLFTLMEDECHKLDLEMAEAATRVTSASDKQSYTNFTDLIVEERVLLDKKKNLEDQLEWLDQTLSLLVLTSPTTSPPIQAVKKAMEERRKVITEVVRKFTRLHNTTYTCIL